MALIPQQLLFLDPPQRKLPEEGLRHKGDKGDEGLLMENRQTTTGTLPTRPPPRPLLTLMRVRTCTQKTLGPHLANPQELSRPL